MRLSLLLAFALLISIPVAAQDKKLTLEDAVLRQRTVLAPKRLVQLQWIGKSSDYSWIETRDKEEVLLKSNALKPAAAEVMKLSKLNELLRQQQSDTVPRFPVLKWKDNINLSFESAGKKWLYSIKDGKLILSDSSTIPSAADVHEDSPSGHIAYVLGNNIWIETNHKSIQVTTDGSYELVYGKSVHREEFGISKGLFWSPKGNLLAFYRMDQSMVTDYPVVDFSDKPAKNKQIKYPFAGDSSHQVTVGVYNVTSGKTIYLQTGMPADQYLTNIAWSPDEKSVFVAVLNRAQDHMKLNEYNATDGAFIRTLFEERDNRYTEPQHPVEFVAGNPDRFVWQSRRDGWNHLYLYDRTGKLIRQLTKGEFEVTDFNGFDSKGKRAFYHATSNTGINRDFFMVDLNSGVSTKLSSGDGVHACIVNPDAGLLFDSWNSVRVPRITTIADLNGKVKSTLLKADNPLADYRIGETRLFSLRAEDSTLLWCRMILPAGFDSTKKYPLIVYVYGGPHVQLVTNSWLGGADMWLHYLAQQGYIVFTLDNRGSANRGKAFEQATFRRLGDVEMKDQITGINYLRRLPYVDYNRFGLNGWSFGGFMTTSLMTKYPGIFKVAVAGGPVIDWSYYEVMYTERYMDTPAENPAGYRLSNLTNYVDQLNGKLMLIHGTDDNVVVWQHSLMFLKKAVSKGVQVDYNVYPGHEHNVMGRDRVHLNDKITRYFNDYLK